MNRIDEATDKAASLIKETASRFNIFPEFTRNDRFQKWAVLVILSFILSLLLTPEIRISHPEYKLGFIAPKDVRADRDFLVVDRNSTEVKRLEVMENIRSVYDYDSNLPSRLKNDIAKAFLSMEGVYQSFDRQRSTIETSPDGKELIAEGRRNFERALGISLNHDEFNILHSRRFAPGISVKIAALITAMYENNLLTHGAFPKQDKDRGIIVRDIRTQKQEEYKDISTILLVNNMTPSLWKTANIVLANDGNDMRRVAVSLSEKMIQPNLTFNKEASEQLRQTILDKVEPVYFQVQKNEVIVREGEKISITDVDKLDAYYKKTGDNRLLLVSIFIGMFLMIIFLTAALYYLSRDWINKHANINIDLLFIAVAVLLQFLAVRVGIFLSVAINRAFPAISIETCYYGIPFAIGSILTAILINRNTALVFSILASFLVTFLFSGKIDISLYSFLGSIAAAYHIVQCRKRSAFFRAGFFLGIINTVVVICLSFLSGNVFSIEMFMKVVMGMAGGILSGFIAAGLSPVFETFFDYTTDIKLLELANLNQPIFQRMIIEAPGTYHHSIVVASMVEAAAEAIGANPLLAKVSAYYHDVGKVKKASYFIENQRNGENRHDKLTPKMSSLVIISHIKDGCELAQEAKLGTAITDIIRQHHGTSLVSYFFEKAKKDKDPSIRSLPETDFRYPGPKPQTREAGLVMLGDVMEASSRTLTNPTPARINSLVKERMERVLADGQLDECDLTLSNLNKISESYCRILNGIFHHRIDYPESVKHETNGTKKETYVNSDRKPPEKNKDRSAAGSHGS